MHLDTLLTELGGTSLSQQVDPSVVASSSRDTLKVVNSVLSPLVLGGCYPEKLPESVTYPAAVYEPVGRDKIGDDGFDMIKVDTHIITVYAKTLAELVPLISSIETALEQHFIAGEFLASEVVNVVIAYDDKRDLRVAAIEVDIASLNLVSQLAPMAFVYYSNVSAAPAETMQRTRQKGVYQFNVMLVCQSAQLQELRQEVKSKLGGLHIDSWPVGYEGGDRIANLGGFVVWRETYSYSAQI